MKSTSHPRKLSLSILALLLVFPFLSPPAMAQAPAQTASSPGKTADPGLSALSGSSPAIRELAALPSPLGLADLERLGLAASGVEGEAMGPYLARLETILSDLASSPEILSAEGEAAKAEACLAYLHRKVFSRYDLNATTMDRLLDSGRFNCVSSAALYMIAARSLGIETTGIRTVDHAFCLVRAEGRDYDVETTNPWGFDPGSKKDFVDNFGKTTGYRYVSPGNYSERQRLSEKELFALILSNRASLLGEKRQYRQALALAADFAILSPGPVARSLLADCVGNLAASLASAGDYAALEALVRGAVLEYGPDGKFSEILRVSVFNRLQQAITRENAAGVPGGTEGWRAVLDEARADFEAGTIDRGNYADLTAYAYSGAAQNLGKGGDWLGAARIAREGDSRLAAIAPADRRLSGVAASCISNFVAVSHNEFARLFNKGSYASALEAIEKAMAQLAASGLQPEGSKAFTADRETALKALAR